jgi:hypothetical protein
MPASTIALLFVSIRTSKPVSLFDIVIRVLLCAWFCALYIRLAFIDEYHIYPNIKWTRLDVGPFEKYYYIACGVLSGFGAALVTNWAIQSYLPVSGIIRLSIVVFNGLIIMLPIASHYWVFKL